MKIQGRPWRTIWEARDGSGEVEILDQTRLPFAVETIRLRTVDDAVRAIADMQVRGAPLIGVTAAYGAALALRADASDAGMTSAWARLNAARPTAVNLAWALEEVRRAVVDRPIPDRAETGWSRAREICAADVATCRAIGEHGADLIAEHARRKPDGGPVNILTHCNAGWLAAVDWGTALAPIYVAQEAGIPMHVWVDETRPRGQGALLTAFELGQQGIAHTIVADNAGGHLMQHGQVDLCLVGSDRTTRTGDVANKIGTYLKALAAHDTGVPFYAVLPGSTIDWRLSDGIAQIPIEHRAPSEVTEATGQDPDGAMVRVRIAAPGSDALNPAFDVTPARLITGIVTERGVAPASEAGLTGLFRDVAA